MNYNYYDNFNTFSGLNNMDNMLDNDFMNNFGSSTLNEKTLINNISNNMMNNQSSNMATVSSLNLYEPLEGYMRGNLFKNLYDPYKNYRPQRMNIKSEKEEMLTSIGEYSFAMHELNLYLDVNPNDQRALNLFNKYREQTNELILKYERKYGPLTINSQENMKVPFSWEASSWPWEV